MRTVSRAVVIGNGVAGAENQCIGLVRALGLSHRHTIYVLTLGALHEIDSISLQSAASVWHDEMGLLPKPLLVVNIGGPTGHCKYGEDLANELTSSLQNVLPTCGSVRISFSRRTPKMVSDLVVGKLGHHPKVYIWNGEADSISMLSEACSTGKPVYVIGAERCTWKFTDFHKTLSDQSMVRPFTGKENISEGWRYSPLNDTKEAASAVINALADRGWRLKPYIAASTVDEQSISHK